MSVRITITGNTFTCDRCGKHEIVDKKKTDPEVALTDLPAGWAFGWMEGDDNEIYHNCGPCLKEMQEEDDGTRPPMYVFGPPRSPSPSADRWQGA